MDPVGPWSAYASYNRLAAAQSGTGAADLHHHLTAAAAAAGSPPATSAQILPGSFLSPPPPSVGYDTVFSPLFHVGAKPPAHYVAQHHRSTNATATTAITSKQTTDGDSAAYHQTSSFFEQSAGATWQQNSPFGILPHESVVATAAASVAVAATTTTSKITSPCENLYAHFAAAQSLNHLVAAKAVAASAANAAARAQSPQQQLATASSNKTSFFQVQQQQENSTKSFNSSNNQSCIVSSPNSVRVPQRVFLNSPNPQQQQQQQQQQTNPTTRIVQNKQPSPPTNKTNNIKEETQSSPISFSMETANRLNYNNSTTSTNKRNFQHNYSRYQSNEDFRSKGDYNTSVVATTNTANGPDCNNAVVVPRRPSPLQAHSQASPLGHAPSPAYPMYNSPMNSISSPQQLTPPSPLDASVPRVQNNVAYPSVITRALNANDKNFDQRFERTNSQQQQTNCWEERQNRKYNALYNNTVDGRQYFDNNQPLQDLTSCRGDPMSIVKNLQQQSCQLSQQQQQQQQQQLDIKQEVKPPIKRRKSTDTGKMSDRIPPPAHSSQPSPQQQTTQQNGSYFDFDRWNLPPTSKIFHQQQQPQPPPPPPQHQGLMLNHPPPPLPYFPPFLPHHPEFQSVGLEAGYDHYQQQQQQHHHHHQQQQQQLQQEDQPKVVVPNIEEELNFLSQDTISRTTSTTTKMPTSVNKPIPNSKTNGKSGPGSGFMSSYLKFLQGERDNSPPPPTRYTSKKAQNWINNSSNSSSSSSSKKDEKTDSNNGTTIKPTPPPPPPPLPPPITKPVTRLSTQGDPQDDPRYFPLPKERKRDSFDSSDDGISSDDDFFGNNNKKTSSQVVMKSSSCRYSSSSNVKSKKSKTKSTTASGSSGSNSSNNERKRKKEAIKDIIEKKDVENIPRRESVKRAAKEKNNLQNLIKISNDDDLEEPPEFQDSDSDPAWTPQAKEDGDDILPVQGKKSKRNRTRQKKKRNLITAAAHGAGIREIDGYSSDATNVKKTKQKNKHVPTLEDNIAAAIPNSSSVVANDEFPYKPGEFVAIKSELSQDWPAIWRVDGKTLLQKYEPFDQNGATLYRNISTYTSWTPESKRQYISIPIKCKSQNQSEVIVEFLKNEMTIIDENFNEKCMKEFEAYQDNFEVYIQTLISQALDSNFLTEIFQEKDEYFLSNVKTIDDITDTKKRKLLNLLKWPPPVQAAVCTWPLFNVIGEIGNAIDVNSTKNCGACGKFEICVRVLMYGQPYNSTTLEGCQPDPKAMNEKNFLMCRICSTRVELANKVTHQKYLMYIECAKRVSEKRTSDPTKDTTCILNELLADENWLNKLFFEVRTTWAEIDCIEYSLKLKNSNSVFIQ